MRLRPLNSAYVRQTFPFLTRIWSKRDTLKCGMGDGRQGLLCRRVPDRQSNQARPAAGTLPTEHTEHAEKTQNRGAKTALPFPALPSACSVGKSPSGVSQGKSCQVKAPPSTLKHFLKCLLQSQPHNPIFRRMKRIFALICCLLAAAPLLRAQDGASAAAVASRQEAAENYNTLKGHVDDMIAAQEVMQKRLQSLAKEISDLRTEMAKPNGNYASQDDLKALSQAVQEIDKKREADKTLILQEMEKLGQGGFTPPPSHGGALTGSVVSNPGPGAPSGDQDGFYYPIKKDEGNTVAHRPGLSRARHQGHHATDPGRKSWLESGQAHRGQENLHPGTEGQRA